MKKWILYNFLIGFSIYWTGNIMLWYPWSVNANLGIALMLTVMPLLWGYGIYSCLARYNGKNIFVGGAITSLVMLVIAALLDYIFFGLVRGAFNDIYKPTTFYGYTFLIALPFVELFILRKRILKKKRDIFAKDFVSIAAVGLASLTIQIVLINL